MREIMNNGNKEDLMQKVATKAIGNPFEIK
jgi:hypothetical protein